MRVRWGKFCPLNSTRRTLYAKINEALPKVSSYGTRNCYSYFLLSASVIIMSKDGFSVHVGGICRLLFHKASKGIDTHKSATPRFETTYPNSHSESTYPYFSTLGSMPIRSFLGWIRNVTFLSSSVVPIRNNGGLDTVAYIIDFNLKIQHPEAVGYEYALNS